MQRIHDAATAGTGGDGGAAASDSINAVAHTKGRRGGATGSSHYVCDGASGKDCSIDATLRSNCVVLRRECKVSSFVELVDGDCATYTIHLRSCTFILVSEGAFNLCSQHIATCSFHVVAH